MATMPINLKDKLADPVFRIVGESADSMGLEVYVVGGYVRDIFLNRTSADMDFVTVGSGIELARQVAARLGKRNASPSMPITAQRRSDTITSNWNLSVLAGKATTATRAIP